MKDANELRQIIREVVREETRTAPMDEFISQTMQRKSGASVVERHAEISRSEKSTPSTGFAATPGLPGGPPQRATEVLEDLIVVMNGTGYLEDFHTEGRMEEIV